MVTVALDAMGGDGCPDINIDGAYDAVNEINDLRILLLGPEALIKEKISSWDEISLSRVEVLDAPEVISTEDNPSRAILKMPNSSIVIGSKLVKAGDADAFISAGSSGAVLAGGQLIVGRIRGVLRPPLASLMPTARGYSLFLDCGANVDAKPEWLRQFAEMGSIYMNKVEDIKNPVVKLANVGPEEEKGNALTKAANALLREASDINYQGYIEFRDIPYGDADVIVADAFTGNAIIKTYEGVGSVLINTVKGVLKTSLMTKLAALMIMKPLKSSLSSYDSAKCGGAILLGLNGVVIKCHGNANRLEIKTSIAKAVKYVKMDVNSSLADAIGKIV